MLPSDLWTLKPNASYSIKEKPSTLPPMTFTQWMTLGGEQVWDHLSSWGPSGSAKVSAILNHPLNKPQLLPCPPGLWPPLTSPSIPLPPTRHGLVISTSICSATSVGSLSPGGPRFPLWGPGFLPRALFSHDLLQGLFPDPSLPPKAPSHHYRKLVLLSFPHNFV